MAIEINVTSRETIKPSSPTPKSLPKHHLSFLDQLAPPFLSPFLYFYSSNPKIPNSHKSNYLKKSLSETLSKFYPLAGRLVGNLYVHCNDGGVPFFEAEANCDLSLVISKPDPKTMENFLPYKPNEYQDFCMAVQATFLRCGGVVVGVLISHKTGDAVSLVSFVNTWSAVARNGGGGGGVPLPEFDAYTYFPPRDMPVFGPSTGITKQDPELESRIFTFPASKIAALRESYSGAGQRRPTRTEALSAFIWTRFITATGSKTGPSKVHVVRHAINLRNRVDPPLSEYHFGNIIAVSTARPAAGDGGAELVKKFREATRAVDGGYAVRLKEGLNRLSLMKDSLERLARANKDELVGFTFSSLCGFPLYESDFGWGEPVWAGTTGFPYMNTVSFMDARSGGGIMALIVLRKDDMEKFEGDLELLILKSNL